MKDKRPSIPGLPARGHPLHWPDCPASAPPARFKKPDQRPGGNSPIPMLVCGDKPGCLVELGRLGGCLKGQLFNNFVGRSTRLEPATWNLGKDGV